MFDSKEYPRLDIIVLRSVTVQHSSYIKVYSFHNRHSYNLISKYYHAKRASRCIHLYTYFLWPFCANCFTAYPDAIRNSRPSPDQEKRESSARSGTVIIGKVSRPTLTVFLPPKERATGAAVIICPGGGYWVLAENIERTEVAAKFVEMGVAAFVLKYRIPSNETMINPEIGPLQDAQQAVKIAREHTQQMIMG